MDRDIQRAQPLGDDPRQVLIGHVRKCHIVAMQEREAVVVVLEIQRLPHPRRKLLDETKQAVRSACPHAIEEFVHKRNSQRREWVLFDLELGGLVTPPHGDVQRPFGAVETIVDNIPQGHAR